jgi:hypothetical protein
MAFGFATSVMIADMREYGGKRRHCVAGKFFGNNIIDFIEQQLVPAFRPFPLDPFWLHVSPLRRCG